MSTLTKLFFFQHILLQCSILHAARLAVLDLTLELWDQAICCIVTLLLCYFVILLLCYFVSLQWPHVRIVRAGILLPSDLTLPVSSLPILLPTQTHKPKERQGEKKTQNGKVGNQSKVRPILGNIFNVFVFCEKNLFATCLACKSERRVWCYVQFSDQWGQQHWLSCSTRVWWCYFK